MKPVRVWKGELYTRGRGGFCGANCVWILTVLRWRGKSVRSTTLGLGTINVSHFVSQHSNVPPPHPAYLLSFPTDVSQICIV